MKNADYLVLGLAGLAVWFIFKGRGAAAPRSVGMPTRSVKVAPDYQGWQYFSDGVAIGPDGTYYMNGEKVWAP